MAPEPDPTQPDVNTLYVVTAEAEVIPGPAPTEENA